MPDIFELTFLPLLIHLSSTPHPFSILLGGHWGSKGPKEIKIRATKMLLPKCLGIDSQVGTALQVGAKNRTKETKPHLIWQALPPFSETPFCIAVLAPPTHCLHLAEPGGCRRCCTAAGTCGCSSLPSTPTHLGSLTAWLLLFSLLSARLLSTAHTQLFAASLPKGCPYSDKWRHSQVCRKILEGVDRNTF